MKYKLIKAKAVHARQIISYYSITCYWREFVEGNTLNQSYEEFMLEWLVKPRLPFITVLVNEADENQIYGCIVAATTKELAAMPDYTPYLHPRVMEIFGAWYSFPVIDGMLVELFAVDKSLRSQGYGKKLWEIALEAGRIAGEKYISGFIWASFTESLVNALKFGWMVTDCIHFPEPVGMPLLYVQGEIEPKNRENYFESEEYQNSHHMLLNVNE